MKKIFLNLLKIILIIPSYTLAQESEYFPASFNNEPDSLQNLIVFPDIGENIDVTARCSSKLSRFGSFQSLVCLPIQYPELLQAIGDVILDAKISPATRDGSRQEVMIPFSVRFVKEGASENLYVYPNFGVGTEILGLEYTAPQRIIRRLIHDGEECLFAITDYWAGVLVSEEGISMDVSISEPHNMTERCVSVHSRYIGDFLFVPAMKDGVAVQASYYERLPLSDAERNNINIMNI